MQVYDGRATKAELGGCERGLRKRQSTVLQGQHNLYSRARTALMHECTPDHRRDWELKGRGIPRIDNNFVVVLGERQWLCGRRWGDQRWKGWKRKSVYKVRWS